VTANRAGAADRFSESFDRSANHGEAAAVHSATLPDIEPRSCPGATHEWRPVASSKPIRIESKIVRMIVGLRDTHRKAKPRSGG
jgi:hypothetical protein